MNGAQAEWGGRARVTVYWVATALLCAELLTGGIWDVLRTRYAVGVVTGLGYPVYVLMVIGVWKLLAVPAVLAPGLGRLKEWAYAGIFFEMTGAAVSHAACGQETLVIAPLVITAIGMVSWALLPRSRRWGAPARAEGKA